MSNVELVQGAYDAFGRGDMESVLAVLDPDIEWLKPEVEGLLYGGTHRGLESVVNEVLALMPQTWAELALRPEEWVDRGDTVVVLGQFTGRGKGGRQGSWRFVHVWKLRGGKAVRVESFYDTLAEWRILGSGR
jgi:ketosteroid isomerase-like protein